jgi:hypothetical protein
MGSVAAGLFLIALSLLMRRVTRGETPPFEWNTSTSMSTIYMRIWRRGWPVAAAGGAILVLAGLFAVVGR